MDKIQFESRVEIGEIIRALELSEAEFNKELEKGYADVQNGRTKNAKKVFADIRKDYGL
jgi:DNA-damage-inducible protein J